MAALFLADIAVVKPARVTLIHVRLKIRSSVENKIAPMQWRNDGGPPRASIGKGGKTGVMAAKIVIKTAKWGLYLGGIRHLTSLGGGKSKLQSALGADNPRYAGASLRVNFSMFYSCCCYFMNLCCLFL